MRFENVAGARRLYPDLDSRVLDVVFSYGLLYHLENPVLGLRNMAGACDDLLLLESVICDSTRPVVRLDDETLTYSQALRGIAGRPSPSYVAMALSRIGFGFVYAAAVLPKHRRVRVRVARQPRLLPQRPAHEDRLRRFAPEARQRCPRPIGLGRLR